MFVVSIGAFADPSFPPPIESGDDSRRHPWITLPTTINRYAPALRAPLLPLHHAREYGEAADRGQQLLEAHPDYSNLFYNVACVESLGGRTADALERLRGAGRMVQSL